jgi:hypothetical protein
VERRDAPPVGGEGERHRRPPYVRDDFVCQKCHLRHQQLVNDVDPIPNRLRQKIFQRRGGEKCGEEAACVVGRPASVDPNRRVCAGEGVGEGVGGEVGVL